MAEYRSCPKCGYTSPEVGNYSGEICGGCGLVFSKYEARQRMEQSEEKAGQRKRKKASSIHKENSNAPDTEIVPGSTRISKLTLVGFVSIIAVTLVGLWIHDNYFSVESYVERRWSLYTETIRNGQSSYEFLTAYSKSRATESEWVDRWRKSDPRYADEVVLVTLRGDEKAVLSVNTLDENDSVVRKGIQTWIKTEGDWYRAWYEDNASDSDEAAKAALNPGARQKSLAETLLFESIRTQWKAEKSALSTKYFYKPTTRVKILNFGPPISELRMLVRYMDSTKNELFDEDEETVVSTSDLPIATGERRTIIFSTSMGFNFDPLTADASDYHKIADRHSTSLYFKANYRDSWVKYD